MNTAVITATSLVVFDAGETSEHLSAQIDDRPDGNNKGKTSFKKGDAPAFLIWCSIPATLSVSAVGGSLSQIGGGIITRHEQDVVEYLARGETTIEIQISPPARGLPSLDWETAASGITLVAGKVLGNGSIASVIFQRKITPTPPPGVWIAGALKWSALAEAYKISTQATTTAKRVVLLAVAGETS